MISCSERSENSNPRSSLVCAQMLLLWKTAAGETSTLRLSKGAAHGAQASFDGLCGAS